MDAGLPSAFSLDKTTDGFGLPDLHILAFEKGVQGVTQVVLCDHLPVFPQARRPAIDCAFVEDLYRRRHRKCFRGLRRAEEVRQSEIRRGRFRVHRHGAAVPAQKAIRVLVFRLSIAVAGFAVVRQCPVQFRQSVS
jgi:hypothetical protein